MSKSKVKNEMINLLKFCRDRPELFNKLYLKRPPCWSRQIDLCRSVVEYRTTVAYSGNMVGEDYWIAGARRRSRSLPAGKPWRSVQRAWSDRRGNMRGIS